MRAVAAGAAIGAGGVLVALLCAVGGVLAVAMAEDLDEDDLDFAKSVDARVCR